MMQRKGGRFFFFDAVLALSNIEQTPVPPKPFVFLK